MLVLGDNGAFVGFARTHVTSVRTESLCVVTLRASEGQCPEVLVPDDDDA